MFYNLHESTRYTLQYTPKTRSLFSAWSQVAFTNAWPRPKHENPSSSCCHVLQSCNYPAKGSDDQILQHSVHIA